MSVMFQEETFAASPVQQAQRGSRFAEALIRIKIAKTAAQANLILIGVFLFLSLIATAVLFLGSGSSYKEAPIHNTYVPAEL